MWAAEEHRLGIRRGPAGVLTNLEMPLQGMPKPESNSETNFTTNANSFTRTQITLFSHESETNLTIFFPSFSK